MHLSKPVDTPGVRWFMRLIPGVALFIVVVTSLAAAESQPSNERAAKIADEFRNELKLLRSQPQDKFTATPEIMKAAQKIFHSVDFSGLKASQIESLLGKPSEARIRKSGVQTFWTYYFHNGEAGVVPNFVFNAEDLVEKMTLIRTE